MATTPKKNLGSFNPFPDYPVLRLNEAAEWTYPTPSIEKARAIVDEFLGQVDAMGAEPEVDGEALSSQDSSRSKTPFFIAVQGDYGTGKTHLLVDATQRLKEGLSTRGVEPVIMMVSALEANPVTWYQNSMGPLLKQPLWEGSSRSCLTELAIRLYAAAGGRVAGKTRLTGAAVDALKEDPLAIHRLVRDNLLNRTALEKEFARLLETVCPRVKSHVRESIASLVKIETGDLAERWLGGEPLDRKELRTLKISRNLSTDGDAQGVIDAVASICAFLGWVFVLVIDEAEHFFRYDSGHKSHRNATWLKRLLESLKHPAPIVSIAGHWSAWRGHSDYLDRFLYKIRLVKLSGSDVLEILRHRVEDLNPSFVQIEEAEVIAESGGGNIRRILSLCRMLFRETDGFRRSLSAQEVAEISEAIGQRLSIEDTALQLTEIFEQHGLTVERDAAVAEGFKFDLVAYKAGKPRFLVSLEHAVLPFDQHQQARLFLEKAKEVYLAQGDVTGLFVASGNVDDDLLAILRSDLPFTLRWFDLSQREVLRQLAEAVEEGLGEEEATAGAKRLQVLVEKSARLAEEIDSATRQSDSELLARLREQRQALDHEVAKMRGHLERQTKEVDRKLDKLERQRLEEFRRLQERLEELSESFRSERQAEVAGPTEEEVRARLQRSYSELIEPPSLLTRLSYVFEPRSVLYGVVPTILGLVVLLLASELTSLWMIAVVGRETEPAWALGQIGVSVFACVAVALGLWRLWRSFAEVNRFFEFASRRLRRLYLRTENPALLLEAEEVLRKTLDILGPREGRWQADEALAELELKQSRDSVEA